MSIADQVRSASTRARTLWADAAEARRERDLLIAKMDADASREEGPYKLREISAASGLTIGHVQRIVVKVSADKAVAHQTHE